MIKKLVLAIGLLLLFLPVYGNAVAQSAAIVQPREQIPILGAVLSYIKALFIPDVITSSIIGSLVSLVVANLFGPITLGLFGLLYGAVGGMWILLPFSIGLAIVGALIGLIAPIGMMCTANPFLGVSIGILSELLSLEPLGAGVVGAIVSALTGLLNFPGLVFFVFMSLSLLLLLVCALVTVIYTILGVILLPLLPIALIFILTAFFCLLFGLLQILTIGIYLIGFAVLIFLNSFQGAISGFVTKWILIRLRI